MATNGYRREQVAACPLGHKVRSGQTHCATCGERLVTAIAPATPRPVFV